MQKEQINELYKLPFLELLFKAQNVLRENFKQNEIELCSLLSIKTGNCPEDCKYCPQSAHYKIGLQGNKLMKVEDIISVAKQAKENGATRFCMAAAWREPNKQDFSETLKVIKAVKELNMETCVTLGLLTDDQALQLKKTGLDYYNHNLDTSPEYYKEIITTRTYKDRISTIEKIVNAGINLCCGGIIGMGETKEDHINFLYQLASLPKAPESIPINKLVLVKGTPIGNKAPEIDNFDFIRIIAIVRIMFPNSMVRLSAGRENMTDEMQCLCFLAGANSIFVCEKLLVTNNSSPERDIVLLEKLGLTAKK